MNRARLVRPLLVLAGTVVLATAMTGCASEVARPTARDVATAKPAPLPVDFCGLATKALPAAWALDNAQADPYDNEALGLSTTCSFGTGYEGDTYTTMIVTWQPHSTAEDSEESLTKHCERISRIASASGALTQRDPALCQGVDNADAPEWTLLAYTDAERTGVVEIRVDTTNPDHTKALAEVARQYATNVVTAVRDH